MIADSFFSLLSQRASRMDIPVPEVYLDAATQASNAYVPHWLDQEQILDWEDFLKRAPACTVVGVPVRFLLDSCQISFPCSHVYEAEERCQWRRNLRNQTSCVDKVRPGRSLAAAFPTSHILINIWDHGTRIEKDTKGRAIMMLRKTVSEEEPWTIAVLSKQGQTDANVLPANMLRQKYGYMDETGTWKSERLNSSIPKSRDLYRLSKSHLDRSDARVRYWYPNPNVDADRESASGSEDAMSESESDSIDSDAFDDE